MPPLDTRVAERRLELDRSLLNVIPQAVQGLAGSIERYGQTLNQNRVFQEQVRRDKENAAIKKAENNMHAFSYMAGYNDEPMALDPTGQPMFDVQTYDMGQRRRRLELGEKVDAENKKAELLQKQADRDAKDAEEGAKMLRKFGEMRTLGTSLGLPEGSIHPEDTEDSVRAKADTAMWDSVRSGLGGRALTEVPEADLQRLPWKQYQWAINKRTELAGQGGVADRFRQGMEFRQKEYDSRIKSADQNFQLAQKRFDHAVSEDEKQAARHDIEAAERDQRFLVNMEMSRDFDPDGLSPEGKKSLEAIKGRVGGGNSRVDALLKKVESGTATPEEKAEFLKLTK